MVAHVTERTIALALRVTEGVGAIRRLSGRFVTENAWMEENVEEGGADANLALREQDVRNGNYYLLFLQII